MRETWPGGDHRRLGGAVPIVAVYFRDTDMNFIEDLNVASA
jgi:hypothetical protein